MAILPKANVSVTIKGLNQKSPNTIGTAGGLEVAENVIIRRGEPGQIQIERRNGVTQVATTNSAPVASGFRLGDYGGSLIATTNSTVERYVPASGFTVVADSFSQASRSLLPIEVVRSNMATPIPTVDGTSSPSQANLGVAYIGNISCVTWINQDAVIVYTITDRDTGVSLASSTVPASGTTKLKIVALGSVFYAFWKEANAIRAASISATSFLLLSTTTVVASGSCLAGTDFDVQAGFDATHIAIMYRSSAANHVRALLNTALAVSTSVTDSTAADQPDVAMCWIPQDTFVTSLYYGTLNAASGAKTQTIDKATLAITATITDAGAIVSGVQNITGYFLQSLGPMLVIESSYVLGGVTRRKLTYSTGILLAVSIGLASKCFYVDGLPCVVGIYNSSQASGAVINPQNTYFVLQVQSVSVVRFGKVAQGSSGLVSSFDISPAVKDASGVVHFACQVASQIATSGGVVVTQYVVSDVGLKFRSSSIGGPTEFGGVLLIHGCQLLELDASPSVTGVALHEQGWPIAPEIPQLTEGAASSGNIPPGTRSIVCRWKWIDSNGQSQFSAMSTPVPITTVQVNSSISVGVFPGDANSLRTARMQIEVCRTPNNGTGDIYYKTSPPVFSSFPGQTYITFVDTASEATLLSGEPFDASATAALDPIAPPALNVTCEHKNRVFGIDAEQPWRIRFSKEYVYGTGVEFTDAFFINTPEGTGPAYGLASMDGHLLVFKKDHVYVIDGDFPDATGGGPSIPLPVLLPVGVGCDQPRSIVVFELGIGFYSSLKGFRLLSRSLSAEYIGAAVEATAQGQTVSGATVHPTYPQVRWTTEGGTTFVLDVYFTKQAQTPIWTTFTNQACVASIVHNGDWYLLTAAGALLKEDLTTWADSTGTFVAKIKIGDISLGGINGFVRCWRGIVLGEWYSSHKVKVTLTMNHRSVAGQVFTYDATNDPDPYLLKFDLGKDQKNTSMDITIQDTADFQGRGFAWSALTFQIGVKPGSLRRGTPFNMTGS